MRRTSRSAPWRAVLAAAAVLGLGLASSSSADTITVMPTGGSPITGVTSLNFSFGDAVAVNAATIHDGDTVQLLYQTALTSYNGADSVISDPRLNAANGYQITAVASFNEVAHVSGTSVTFTLAPTQPAGSGATIYEQALGATGPTFNFATGTGFTNGTVIASSTLTSVASDFSASTGTGQAETSSTVTSSDSTFFVTPIGGTTSMFQGGLSSTFFGGPVPNSVNGHAVTSSDLPLQVSGGVQSFAAAVPEPASMVMAFMALGIVPLATWQVRRRRARA